MDTSERLLHALRTWHKMPAAALLEHLGVSRATLMRAVHTLGPQVIALGKARRTAYAARRTVRGQLQAIPLYRIDEQGRPHESAVLHPLHPQGCAVSFTEPSAWPLGDEAGMADGWFEGLPYMLDDMRPQGFLGRHFARHHADLLQVAPDPQDWSEDDVLHALTLLGHDQIGHYVLGEPALRRYLDWSQQGEPAVQDADVATVYARKAQDAMGLGLPGSLVGGEFPKFTAFRDFGDVGDAGDVAGHQAHVIVKFSGSDASPGTVRWSDLLVCEHLALCTVASHLDVQAAVSRVFQADGRTFLEVERFDRHGRLGRSAVCSWAALNGALFGLARKPWTEGAAALRQRGLVSAGTEAAVQRIWLFGQLIANTDMHDGNLAFRPGLSLAPVYDMLPMAYAPMRGVELPERDFVPRLPLPAQREAWQCAAQAAEHFWALASGDARISPAFRAICAGNAEKVRGARLA